MTVAREAENTHPKGRGCWYFVSARECPPCGRWIETRERRTDAKPPNPAERREIITDYCGCLG